jgi:hypothetical protein
MKNRIALFTLALTCIGTSSAFAMTKEEYKVQKDRIEADYKATREKCKTFEANAKDICQAEAKNIEKVARAELDAQYKPSAGAEKRSRAPKLKALMEWPRKSAMSSRPMPRQAASRTRVPHATAPKSDGAGF